MIWQFSWIRDFLLHMALLVKTLILILNHIFDLLYYFQFFFSQTLVMFHQNWSLLSKLTLVSIHSFLRALICIIRTNSDGTNRSGKLCKSLLIFGKRANSSKCPNFDAHSPTVLELYVDFVFLRACAKSLVFSKRRTKLLELLANCFHIFGKKPSPSRSVNSRYGAIAKIDYPKLNRQWTI